jgi:hypothetical protein
MRAVIDPDVVQDFALACGEHEPNRCSVGAFPQEKIGMSGVIPGAWAGHSRSERPWISDNLIRPRNNPWQARTMAA